MVEYHLGPSDWFSWGHEPLARKRILIKKFEHCQVNFYRLDDQLGAYEFTVGISFNMIGSERLFLAFGKQQSSFKLGWYNVRLMFMFPV